MFLHDADQRSLAQDLRYSCVVRAPAGSGKTELLVQRALRALLAVEEPEQVLLLTFTNKAVEELRERMTSWISQSDVTHKGLEETARLALAVQHRSAQKNWQLNFYPHRLQIFTLDSYFSKIYQRFSPLSDSFNHELLSEPRDFYEEIINDALEQIFSEEKENSDVLDLFEGSVAQLRELFLGLTLSRDRWLSALYAEGSFADIFNNLNEECNILSKLTENCAIERDRAAAFISQYDSSWPYILSPDTPQYWQKWAHVLLTEKHTWRQSFRKDQGMPPKTELHSWHNPDERETALADLTVLSSTLQSAPISQGLLRLFRMLPAEHEGAVALPEVLVKLLKKWLALISVIKQERCVIDFIDLTFAVASFFHHPEISGALEAFIDKSISHILIDEIQDLSLLQFQIIRAFLKNFCYQPEKSAFMVGDPQQAIYHFRGAHVGVFAEFERLDLEGLPKKNCVLQSNFRSASRLVSFVNEWALQVFGSHSSAWLGIDKALQSSAMLDHQGVIETLSTSTVAQESFALYRRIKMIHSEHPEATIAVLARDRASLYPLMHLLNYYHLSYDAADIIALSQYSFFTDLKVLMAIILQPAERCYWLPFLRSAWLRASYDDINLIYESKMISFWDLTEIQHYSMSFQHDYALWKTLVLRFLPYKGRSPFWRFWNAFWKNLSFDSSLDKKERQIWQIVQILLKDYDWQTPVETLLSELTQKIDKSPAEQGCSKDSRLKLMTIHKAKGLEFDWVLLPNIAARLPSHNKPFLLEVPIVDQLFWAVNMSQNESFFKFLDDVLKQQQDHEFQRLLYVGLTRARTGLVLSYNEEKNHQRSFLSSLKDFIPEPQQENASFAIKKSESPSYKRIYKQWHHWVWDRFLWNDSPISWSPPAAMEQERERLVGLVLHHCLSFFNTRPWPQGLITRSSLEKLWFRFGGSVKDLFSGLTQIGRGLALLEKSTALDNVFDPRHLKVYNEYILFTQAPRVAHQCRQMIIDRLIQCQDGSYWVIEWKTGASWRNQWPMYRAQLISYSQNLCQALHIKSVRISLYVLVDDFLYTWEKAEDIPQYFQELK